MLSRRVCFIQPALLCSRFSNDGSIQLRPRGICRVLPLITILASVLGGVDPFGGFGKVLGLLLSLLLLQAISTGFNLFGFSPHLTEAIWGATLILAILIALIRDRWLVQSQKPRAVTTES